MSAISHAILLYKCTSLPSLSLRLGLQTMDQTSHDKSIIRCMYISSYQAYFPLPHVATLAVHINPLPLHTLIADFLYLYLVLGTCTARRTIFPIAATPEDSRYLAVIVPSTVLSSFEEVTSQHMFAKPKRGQ